MTTPSHRRPHRRPRPHRPAVFPSSPFVVVVVVVVVVVLIANAVRRNVNDDGDDDYDYDYRTIDVIPRVHPRRLLLLIAVANAQLYPEDDPSTDYYCGFDWVDANAECKHRCPSGLDVDCPPSELTNGGYVLERRCIASAGCSSRLVDARATVILSLTFDPSVGRPPSPYDGNGNGNGAVVSNYTAAAAVDENDGTDGGNDTATSIVASQSAMGDGMIEILEFALSDHLSRTMGGVQNDAIGRSMLISSVTVVDQRYDRPCVDAVIVYDREEMENDVDDEAGGGMPSMVTSLDVTIDVIVSYIPTNDDEAEAPIVVTEEVLGNSIASSINSNRDALLMTIRGNASISSSNGTANFLDALLGVYAIEEGMLPESPSSSPSSSPTRDYMQSLDVDIDANPTGSYGLVFEVGTPRHGNTIVMTSMSFVTSHTGELEYEIYTKLGSFLNYLGDYSKYDMIASGRVYGMGPSEYTRVLDNDTIVEDVNGTYTYLGFRHVYVPGDGGRRSFYLTLTKRFVADDGSAIPVLFSLPLEEDDEGAYEYSLVDANSELEVYEGDGVLDYPWPRTSGYAGGGEDDDVYYRRPRGFFGSFEYDRVPCYPTMNFTGWPCPYAFSESSTSIEGTTGDPIIAPSRNPTNDPLSLFVGDGARDETMNNSSADRNNGIENEVEDPSNSSASSAMWIAHGSCILWIITQHALSLLLGGY